ncbi:hypothetical protein [Desulfobacter vibrioformis]|uniref:hypothetical protein n=1 Tax=Desulfobacter vibrioformis TaxID=34031 RepID=UPI000551007E|nr:hypothetical protein [Desulfobacter vibrioformis]
MRNDEDATHNEKKNGNTAKLTRKGLKSVIGPSTERVRTASITGESGSPPNGSKFKKGEFCGIANKALTEGYDSTVKAFRYLTGIRQSGINRLNGHGFKPYPLFTI